LTFDRGRGACGYLALPALDAQVQEQQEFLSCVDLTWWRSTDCANLTVPAAPAYVVARGGSFQDAAYLRGGHRRSHTPTQHWNFGGIRCARVP
jgi:formylglycine-generating enzyme required for sulfatase activity